MSCRIIAAALGALLPLTAMLSIASAVESERILPETTRAWFSIPDPRQLDESWQKSRLLELGKDIAMKPFLDAARKSFEHTAGDLKDVADITLEELRTAAGGEVCLAAVEVEGNKAALAALIDVHGKTAEVQELIAKIDAGLKRRGATHSTEKAGDITVHVYAWKDRNDKPRTSAYAMASDMLVVSSSVEVVKSLFVRLASPGTNALAGNPGFRDVIDRSMAAAGGLAPQLRWYLDPFRFAELISSKEAKFARKHGLDGVKAVGGVFNFVSAGCDVVARVAVYAPPPREGALKMIALAEGAGAPPLPWAIDDLDCYSELNLNLTQLLNNAGGLFDDLVADGISGTFNDILDDLSSDEGPGVDIRRELLPIVGPRVVLMSDHVEPPSLDSERTLIAIQTSSPAAAAGIVERLMRDDPDVHRVTLPGQPYILWHVADVETASYPNMGMMVANGYLLVANNGDLIRKVLASPHAAEAGPAAAIGTSADYTQVAAKMTELGAEGASARLFSRTRRAYYTSYELIRGGKLDDLKSMTAGVVRGLFGKDEDRLDGLPKLDFSTLPPFDAVKPHLHPVGVFVKNQPTGWLVVGFVPR